MPLIICLCFSLSVGRSDVKEGEERATHDSHYVKRLCFAAVCLCHDAVKLYVGAHLIHSGGMHCRIAAAAAREREQNETIQWKICRQCHHAAAALLLLLLS